MAGQLDVWRLLDDAHDLVVNLHNKIWFGCSFRIVCRPKNICLRYVLSESESFICCLSPGIKTILGIENECCKLISGSSSLERKKYSMDQVSWVQQNTSLDVIVTRLLAL
jgi:hypothetical protein